MAGAPVPIPEGKNRTFIDLIKIDQNFHILHIYNYIYERERETHSNQYTWVVKKQEMEATGGDKTGRES